jgi:hypothetical protein
MVRRAPQTLSGAVARLLQPTDGDPGPENRQVSQTRAARDGEPQFLEVIMDCLETRAKLLGLYSPSPMGDGDCARER